MKRIYRIHDAEEFAYQAARQIVEMIMKGEKVYLTQKASEILGPMLEKYGIVLVPATKIEYPSILLDIEEEGKITISFLEERDKEMRRKIIIETFMKELEEELKKRRKKKGEVLVLTLN